MVTVKNSLTALPDATQADERWWTTVNGKMISFVAPDVDLEVKLCNQWKERNKAGKVSVAQFARENEAAIRTIYETNKHFFPRTTDIGGAEDPEKAFNIIKERNRKRGPKRKPQRKAPGERAIKARK